MEASFEIKCQGCDHIHSFTKVLAPNDHKEFDGTCSECDHSISIIFQSTLSADNIPTHSCLAVGADVLDER